MAVLKSFEQSVSSEQFPHLWLYWSPFNSLFQANNSPTYGCIEVLSTVCFNRKIPPPMAVLKSFQQPVSTERPPLWLYIILCWQKNTQGRWVQSLCGGTKECSRIGRLTLRSLPQSLVTPSQGSVTGEMNRPVFVSFCTGSHEDDDDDGYALWNYGAYTLHETLQWSM